MGRFGDFIRRLFSRKQLSASEVAELRIAFKDRYHNFKLLLNANNRALGVMAEIEEALTGIRSFGMTRVRALCTRAATHVFQIVKNLNELAPGKYEALQERFAAMQTAIEPFLAGGAVLSEGELVLALGDVHGGLAAQVGPKIANLGEIRANLGMEVPRGFVVTVAGYRHFAEHNDLPAEIDRRIQAADAQRIDDLHRLSSSLQQLITESEVPEDLAEAIREHYRLLEKDEGEGIKLAVRSSALCEDAAGSSFAGQYRSVLNVGNEQLLQTYKEVVASKYSLPAMTYRLTFGIRDEDVPMCVGCLRMVDTAQGGVLYTRNPVRAGDDSITITSTWGLPTHVVEGQAGVDLFVVSRGDPPRIQQKEIGEKTEKAVCSPNEGVERAEVNSEARRLPSLSDEQVLELADLAVRVEDHYGAPQDIEWAVRQDGSISILQCRPLQQNEAPARSGAGAEAAGPAIAKGGVTAAPGVAAGPVYVVKKEVDILLFPEGAVLVALQASPRWAPLVSRAAAVVCERGTVTCHLANVARELGTAALFGVEGAVERLPRGEVITVDADGRSLYDGRVETLLQHAEKPRNRMAGSPVFEALEGASRYIVPLNLIDPSATAFRPQNCKTFHDITRFCHEKAVVEMFSFGKSHHFPERSSKQLYCDVPMQWWVLNLDDGFKEEVEGKYARIESIASIPMLALWEGITAIPWEGPPPLDGKGFMSVMFGATQNPALNPTVRSSYSDRNYFMISKNYLSLSSRLGAHFSIVEALVSERVGENYISFQFKGGAADLDRRLKRVAFVREILDEYDFRVEMNQDNLIARLENFDEEFMKGHLRILGYLTIHTRQIDMIMSNDAMVRRYREKFHEDIREILSRAWQRE